MGFERTKKGRYKRNNNKYIGKNHFKKGTNSVSSSTSSSSCCTASTDLPNPLSPPVSIVHRSRQFFKATSCIGSELLYIGSS